jgi:hypothetical protein
LIILIIIVDLLLEEMKTLIKSKWNKQINKQKKRNIKIIKQIKQQQKLILKYTKQVVYK